MAIEVSPKYEASLQFPHYPHLHALIAGRPIVEAWRSVMRNISPTTPQPLSIPETPAISNVFEAGRNHYQEHHWSYFDGIIEPRLYSELIAHWPGRKYFAVPREITKSYDVGFKWIRGGAVTEDLKRFPALERLFNYFKSDEYAKRMTAFVGSEHLLSLNTFLVNVTYPGSCVIPHRDTPLPPEAGTFINTVFFIKGTGGGDSGELSLSKDNEQKEMVFTPPTLNNSCILYDTEAPFYHGFPPVAWGKQRYAITASFCRADYTGGQKG